MRNGPVPADPGQDDSWPVWEPVITRPDPMTAEEWQTRADCDVDDDFDPERFQDEDEFLRLGEEDFTEAELAEIAEAMAALPAKETHPCGITAHGRVGPCSAHYADIDFLLCEHWL
jgi:hypothetical protein